MTRRELLYPEIARLREVEGLQWVEIGAMLGLAKTTVHEYYSDPTAERARARKAKGTRACVDCGTRCNTDGSVREASVRCVPCAQAASVVWSREEVVEAIREWARLHGGPPTATDWHGDVGHRGAAFPATNTVRKKFGSWNAGMEAAGFRARPMGHYGRPGEDPAVVAETVALYESGLSMAEVGRRMGVTTTGVRYRLRKAGVPRRRRWDYGVAA